MDSAPGPPEPSGTVASFAIVDFTGDCASDRCVYTVTTNEPAGTVSLDMTETGDPAGYEYWETHTGFTLASSSSADGETYELTLAWVTSVADVVANETTLFNPVAGDGEILWRTTWYFDATSADGRESDCVVIGDDPSFYVDLCTNVW